MTTNHAGINYRETKPGCLGLIRETTTTFHRDPVDEPRFCWVATAFAPLGSISHKWLALRPDPREGLLQSA